MPSTALTTARLGLKDRWHYFWSGTPTVVEHRGNVPESYPDAQVNQREVVLYRPPTTLASDGSGMPGISKEMFAHYLVSVIRQSVGSEIAAADVRFGEAVGRFASVTMILPAWQAELDFVIPIGMISQEIKEALDIYMAGLTERARIAHRGHQNVTQANRLFDTAQRRFIALRDGDRPHFQTDAEFMFLVGQCQRAMDVSPLRMMPPAEKIMDRTPATAQPGTTQYAAVE